MTSKNETLEVKIEIIDNLIDSVAVFTWEREARSWGRSPILQTLAVPATEMFNISAYKQGDFKQFFVDPRTREEYLKWAPLLLTAEDFLASKLQAPERSVS